MNRRNFLTTSFGTLAST